MQARWSLDHDHGLDLILCLIQYFWLKIFAGMELLVGHLLDHMFKFLYFVQMIWGPLFKILNPVQF